MKTHLKKVFKNKIITNLFLVIIILGITMGVISLRSANVKNKAFVGDPKSLDGNIFTLEQTLKENKGEKNIEVYLDLSLAYLQKIRETADSSYYKKIKKLIDDAEKISPNNSDILSIKAEIELGLHNFKNGEEYIKESIKLNPKRARYYGILGDALIELGEYSEAANSYQQMVDLRPDYSAFIRIAYIRELYGDIKGAKESLASAISAGSNFKENIAFAYVELGKLEMRESLIKARENFDIALNYFENYSPALEGLGKVAYFEGDIKKSEEYFLNAFEKQSTTLNSTNLADLNLVQGKAVEANRYLTLARLGFTSSSKSGVYTDLEESIFLSEHDLDLPGALLKAEAAYKERQNIYKADALSFALYKNNQKEKALTFTSEVFELGENDSNILFHQGMIALENGQKEQAKKYFEKALKINPYFSILNVKKAKEILKDIN